MRTLFFCVAALWASLAGAVSYLMPFNQVLPSTPSVYIVSSAYASLPAPGNRVGPANASNMAKIVTPNTNPAIKSAIAAHHYRFVGIEITTTLDGTFSLATFGQDSSGNNVTTVANLPTNIVFDRCYIHGTTTGNLQRAIQFNAASSAVIDSYISDAHWVGADAQAIAVWNSPGPIKYVNNYLEGSGENTMFGGADPKIANLVPSDIEIRRNHYFKPLSWFVSDPSYAGIHWSVKNLFELKNAKRVLIEGNIFENNWADSQSGYAILFTVRNQDNSAPWSDVHDVTFRKNIVRHSASAIDILAYDNTFAAGSVRSGNIAISDVLWDDITGGSKWGGGDGNLYAVFQGPNNVSIQHTTGFATNAIMLFDGSRIGSGLAFQNNIAPQNGVGVIGTNFGSGNPTLNHYSPSAVFDHNALIGTDNTATYPAGQFWPANTAAVGFVNYAGGDYHLTGGSAYHNAGSDGKDLGADIDAVNAATLHAIDGLWGSEPVTYSTTAGTVAEVPRVFLDTTYTPQTGNTITVHSGGDLQAAINSASIGDTIVLDAGAVFTGNFTLPNK